MEELKAKMKEIEKFEDKLFEAAKDECCDGGDICKAGQIVDMLKDMASVKKDCAEACYYKTIIEAMKEDEEYRYGYNPNRYADGRYAPSGHGNYTSGYTPYYRMDPHDVMGYYPSGAGNRSQAGNKIGYVPTEPIMQRYGRPWEEYQEARRHYHDTKDPSSKQEMDKKTKEHITDSVETIYDMYEEADPEMKKQIKEKLTALVNNMTAR